MPEPTTHHLIPPPIAGYTVVAKIEAVAVSELYVAERDDADDARGRPGPKLVVVKVLRGSQQPRLVREAARLVEFSGIDGVVQVVRWEPSASPPYLLLAYMAGGSLEHQTTSRGGVLEVDIAAGYIHRVAQIVAEIHQRGAVVLDLKPANFLIDDHGDVHVADFGSLKAHGEQPTFTTRPYSPPDRAASPAFDVYSLAMSLLRLITGHTLSTNPSALEHVRNDGLRDLLRRSLSDRPDARPRDASRFADELAATGVVGDARLTDVRAHQVKTTRLQLPPVEDPGPRPSPAPKRKGRRRLALLTLLTLGLLAGGYGAYTAGLIPLPGALDPGSDGDDVVAADDDANDEAFDAADEPSEPPEPSTTPTLTDEPTDEATDEPTDEPSQEPTDEPTDEPTPTPPPTAGELTPVATARPPAAPAAVTLADLDPVSDRDMRVGPVNIAGEDYPDAIYHSWTQCNQNTRVWEWQLNGRYDTLDALIGIDTNATTTMRGYVELYTETGEVLHRAEVGFSSPERLEGLDVAGVGRLLMTTRRTSSCDDDGAIALADATLTPADEPSLGRDHPGGAWVSTMDPVDGARAVSTVRSVGGTIYPRAVAQDLGGCDPDVEAEYNLAGDFASLSGVVGIDDFSDSDLTADVRILADGATIWEGSIGLGRSAPFTNLSVDGVLRLSLSTVMTDGDFGLCSSPGDVVWGDVRLDRAR